MLVVVRGGPKQPTAGGARASLRDRGKKVCRVGTVGMRYLTTSSTLQGTRTWHSLARYFIKWLLRCWKPWVEVHMRPSYHCYYHHYYDYYYYQVTSWALPEADKEKGQQRENMVQRPPLIGATDPMGEGFGLELGLGPGQTSHAIIWVFCQVLCLLFSNPIGHFLIRIL